VIDLSVTGLAFGGRGVARAGGLAVFVQGGLPGDELRARIVRRRSRYAEAVIDELRRPSALRVAPPCPYSGVCGGCTWQHLAYPWQLQAKRRFVIDCLERLAQLRDVPVHATIASPLLFGYRNKMEFTCTDRPWLTSRQVEEGAPRGQMGLGLHVPGSFDRVLDIAGCLLQPVDGNRILETARRFIAGSTRPVYGLRSHTGFWRFVVLRHSVARGGWLVNLVTAAEDLREVAACSARLVAGHPTILTVVNNITARLGGAAVGEKEIPLHGREPFSDRIGSLEFIISANSFFQTNTGGALRLYQTVARMAALQGTETVLDLYSGTGTIPLFLASAARRVVGVELNPGAVGDAEHNCRRNGVSNCRFVVGDARTALSGMERPEVLILDPPRTGVHPDVIRRVLELAPPRIIYVSCNPATLARDLLGLAARYRVAEVQPVDMFPHTYHIEAVARLERVTLEGPAS
jgi:23S rRNA (uracil1939-C5)-methyltransferase